MGAHREIYFRAELLEDIPDFLKKEIEDDIIREHMCQSDKSYFKTFYDEDTDTYKISLRTYNKDKTSFEEKIKKIKKYFVDNVFNFSGYIHDKENDNIDILFLKHKELVKIKKEI